jgi:hypothetical protein
MVCVSAILYYFSAPSLVDKDFIFDRIVLYVIPFWFLIHLSYSPFIFPGNCGSLN